MNNQETIIKNIQKLPEELEMKIWKYHHSYNVFKINQKIKYEVGMFNCGYNLDGGIIHEFWFNMNLRQLPSCTWRKMAKHHNRYKQNYDWYLLTLNTQ